MSRFAAIAFDGDDTLWHNERLFSVTQERFRSLVAPYMPRTDDPHPTIDERLLARERANLALFGYGVKGFALSMVETAIEVSHARVPAATVGRIIDLAKAMLTHPIQLIEGVEACLDALADRYPLWVITKGDLFDQESKLARSGLAERFERVEIVSEKDEATYTRIAATAGVAADRLLMVGNSIRSDIRPVVTLGGHGVHVPYHLTWAIEHDVADDLPGDRVHQVDGLGELPGLLERLET